MRGLVLLLGLLLVFEFYVSWQYGVGAVLGGLLCWFVLRPISERFYP